MTALLPRPPSCRRSSAATPGRALLPRRLRSDVLGLLAQVVVFSFIAKLVEPGKLPDLRRHRGHLPGVRRHRARAEPGARRAAATAWPARSARSSCRARSSRCSRRRRRPRPSRSARSPRRCSCRAAARDPDARRDRASCSGCTSTRRILPAAADHGRARPVRVGPRPGQRRRDRHVPPRHRRCSAPHDAARPRVRRVLPARPAARLARGDRRVEPARDRDRRRARGAARRRRLDEALRTSRSCSRSPAVTLAVGVYLFRLALDRERRLGTLGMY